MKKIISLCLSATLLSSFVSSNIETNSEAASYRMEYTVYGDVNGDKVIDSFDVVEMRGRLVDGADYNFLLDLNHDEAVDAEDLQLLQDYILGRIAIFDAYYYDDADTDGICDLFEIAFFETNPDSEDTDGDTLSDYDEIVYTKTLPTTKYTNGLSITDAEDDTDGDKLTNAEEIKYGTLAFLEDSDDDDISDYDEINTYQTDPNDEDSDDDYIFDGDEIDINLNPNNPSTDGVVQDSEYIISQNIAASSTALSTINKEDNSYELSIDTDSAGVAEKSISVSVSQFSGAFNEIITGKAVDISYNENLKVENIKLNFALKEDELIDNTAEDFMIFEYFPDKNYLLPVETKYDGNTVYVESPRVGTYCLVNTAELFENQFSEKGTGSNSTFPSNNNQEIFTNPLVLDYELGEIEVSFFVDISGCLKENLEETKKSIHDCSQAIFEHSDDATVAIIGYYSNPTTYDNKIIAYSDLNNISLFRNIESVDEALNSISPYTTNNNSDVNAAIYGLESLIDYGLYSSDCKNKYAFIISDSTYSFSNSLGYELVVPDVTCESLESIYNEGIRLNFLLSSNNYDNTTAIENLREACEPYGFGIFSKSELKYFANTAFSEIYSNAVVDLTLAPVTYNCSVTPDSIPKLVNRNAFINSLNIVDKSKLPEADENGNINFIEAAINLGLAHYDVNGDIKFEDYYDACEVYELTLKGYDQLMSNLRTSTKLILSSVQITPFSEKILYSDKDGDGINDFYDPYPDEPFDDRFEIVESLEHVPQVKFTEEHYQRSVDCYDSLLDIPKLYAADDDLVALMFLSFLADNTEIPGYLFSFFYHDEDLSISDCAGKMKHASEALSNYLNNKGKTITYDSSEMYEIISSSPMNKIHLVNNLNRAMKCCEEIVNDGNEICISTTIDSKFKICCFDNKSGKEFPNGTCDIDKDEIQHSYGNYANEKHMDWQNTIGEAFGGIVCQVKRNKGHYTMTYYYHLSDIYEWAGHDDTTALSSILHRYHEDGRAKDFLMNGCIKGVIEWDYGDRFNGNQDIEYILTNMQEVEEKE